MQPPGRPSPGGPARARRALAATAAHIRAPTALRTIGADRSEAHIADALAAQNDPARSSGGQAAGAPAPPPPLPAYALPPTALVRARDLPSATRPELTPEEVERFKRDGFVLKRGLIPRAELEPWVDRLWATAEGDPKFAGSLSRADPASWQDPGERWRCHTDHGHGRDEVHLTPNSQWRWHGLGHDPAFVAASSAHPNVLRLVESLLGGPIKRPTRNRAIYSIFPRTVRARRGG